MENSRLENKATDIHVIIDDLIAEVENAENDLRMVTLKLQEAEERISELENEISELQSAFKN